MGRSESIAVGRSLTRHYSVGSEVVTAVDGVDVDIASGGMTVIAGPSGSGKSTLLRIIGCLDRPTIGSLAFDGRDVTALRARARRRIRRDAIGWLHAAPAHNLIAAVDAAGNLAIAGRLRRQTVRPAEALERVGLTGRGAAHVTDLSGGEQLRLGLAIALVGPPVLVVADEPTASLDADAAEAVADLMASVVGGGTTFVVASHDAHVIARADTVIRLDHGRRVA